MLAILGLLLLSVPAIADDCARDYRDRIEKLETKDAAHEAIAAYCEGEAHFKALTGIEYLIPGVPERWRNDRIPIEAISYFDAIECDEQSDYLALQDAYVRGFNQQMVECLEAGGQCCP